ncbi:type ISP restriction/modification enzyme [Ammonifex thiophilus]|uniref:site-specific DNA-methyltransferase (adenine-specific) n=1 Tax=Ammonifex thiophilus TaxID=444093 RepID=A0A3D8P281_9THEO|nr:type ISP restriction/modification enzyme [Ammonifex thiophilus]RDV82321.1 DNA methyltransferase [Ammonifex thiophilus]
MPWVKEGVVSGARTDGQAKPRNKRTLPGENPEKIGRGVVTVGIPLNETCKEYLKKLREIVAIPQATCEQSLYSVLEEMLRTVAEQLGHHVQIISEPKRVKVGKPDFTVIRGGLPIGYIEAEPFGANLDALSGRAREQNERFAKNLDNFLQTNFLEFRLFLDGELVNRAVLPTPPPKGIISVTDREVDQLKLLLNRFFEGQLPATSTPKELAVHLARRTRQLRNEILEALVGEDTTELHEIYEAFKEVLLPDLDKKEFADLYAQTITYGLFAARCTVKDGNEFTRSVAADLIPKTNPFLRKLFQHVAAHDLDERIAWIADDITAFLRRVEITPILRDFGKRTGKEDPVVHFYETFLAEYDPEIREIRGVYYTPEPVINYIVRSVDYLLKTRLDRPAGLVDGSVLVLDPACGTGGFLSAVIDLVQKKVAEIYGKGIWKDYVKDKLLPRLFGFELMVAPYAIAHLKLGLQLQETGCDFQGGQRIRIYLTNTLEEAIRRSELLFGKFITVEASEAAAVKRDKPILVVVGNPPYSGHSANRSWKWVTRDDRQVKEPTWIGRLVEDYKYLDGKPLGERNPKWLQDDYVKFIRFAQWRIDQTGEGIVGFITNHAYLDNPTFRGMRWHLMQSFSELYILNLHGNARKKEKAPDGSKDENVFDIQQGVAILLAVKKREKQTGCRVFYADLWGSRDSKYQKLNEALISTTEWTELKPQPPFYLFTPLKGENLKDDWERYWSIADIFFRYSVGIVTARDKLTIHFAPDEVWETVVDFVSLEPEVARAKFSLGSDARDWRIEKAQEDLRRMGVPNVKARQHIIPLLYRPFDIRFTFFTGKSRGFHCYPRTEVMQHMLVGENVALLVPRRVEYAGEWRHVFVTNTVSEHVAVSLKTIDYHFPLYLFHASGHLDDLLAYSNSVIHRGRQPNLKPSFLQKLAETLQLPQEEPYGLPETIAAEDILGYIYAILHSTVYREQYSEFLRLDFPRIPLTGDLDLFRDLAELGKQLVALHLLDEKAAPVLQNPICKFPVPDSNRVELVRYNGAEKRVLINDTQFFENVPEEAWEFWVGSYQVCKRWLEERERRVLTLDEILRYQRIVTAIVETTRLMEAIDERIPSFPLP